MNKSKISSFVATCIAMLEGDTARVTSEKNWRIANNILETQTHVLKGKIISKENELELAIDEAKKIDVNYGKPINNDKQYIESLFNHQQKIINLQEELKLAKMNHQFICDKLTKLREEITL